MGCYQRNRTLDNLVNEDDGIVQLYRDKIQG